MACPEGSEKGIRRLSSALRKLGKDRSPRETGASGQEKRKYQKIKAVECEGEAIKS